ncbi:hypothetical protein BHU72_09220 [Desulfuribacillus stibiiarsenatis]|uniref:YhfM-like domain-containing protein n=1 Tax=Desulfuribacillus stibiiarsenatis TaxID=1390249 RepID=A0A1E5L3G0_9FIRM|nr:hypothetical protein [Desulfuribacillus stibiiarsenatis]OEH84662.1 hypothetical protein BHU72_09220 [Desulfuribacillus stibiiarsenatis]
MKRIIMVILLWAFIAAIIFGCQLKDNNTSETQITYHELQLLDNERLKLDGEIKKVVFKSKGVSETIFEEKEVLETFGDLITTAVRVAGIANMATPEVYFDVVYENENKQRFFLWIGKKEQNSTLMSKDDTHTIYIVSEKMISRLIDLVEQDLD